MSVHLAACRLDNKIPLHCPCNQTNRNLKQVVSNTRPLLVWFVLVKNSSAARVHLLDDKMVQDHLFLGSLDDIFFNTVLSYQTVDVHLNYSCLITVGTCLTANRWNLAGFKHATSVVDNKTFASSHLHNIGLL